MSEPNTSSTRHQHRNKTQSSLALLIQTYANSINEQPTVDFQVSHIWQRIKHRSTQDWRPLRPMQIIT
jgi:hypothetical protein